MKKTTKKQGLGGNRNPNLLFKRCPNFTASVGAWSTSTTWAILGWSLGLAVVAVLAIVTHSDNLDAVAQPAKVVAPKDEPVQVEYRWMPGVDEGTGV